MKDASDLIILESEHSKVVDKLVKPGADLLPLLSARTMDFIHMGMGICGEVGELLHELQLRGDQPTEETSRKILLELGDIEFYMRGLALSMRIPLPATVLMSQALPDRRMYFAIRVSIQAANVLDAMKKYCLQNNEPELIVMQESLLMLRNAMDELYCVLGIRQVDAIKANINKLARRYGPQLKYSDAAAERKADKEPDNER